MKLYLILLCVSFNVSFASLIFPLEYNPPTPTASPPIVVRPTTRPRPLRCGPIGIPIGYSEEIAEDLAWELAKVAGVIFSNSEALNLTGAGIIMEYGSDLELPYKERAVRIAEILAEMRNSTVSEPILLAARIEVHRIQRLTREMETIELEAAPVLKNCIAVPFEQSEVWMTAKRPERKNMILAEINKELCKGDP